MPTPRRRAASTPPDPSTPRIGRPPAPEEEAALYQIQVRVTGRVEAQWRDLLARLQSEQPLGRVRQGDALAWLLDGEARRAEARAARRGAGKG